MISNCNPGMHNGTMRLRTGHCHIRARAREVIIVPAIALHVAKQALMNRREKWPL